MTISEKLNASKNGLDALLTFANAKTGKGDTSLGDAVKTLVDGFGGGGSLEIVDRGEYTYTNNSNGVLTALFTKITETDGVLLTRPLYNSGIVMLDVPDGQLGNNNCFLRAVVVYNAEKMIIISSGSRSGVTSRQIGWALLSRGESENTSLAGSLTSYTGGIPRNMPVKMQECKIDDTLARTILDLLAK